MDILIALKLECPSLNGFQWVGENLNTALHLVVLTAAIMAMCTIYIFNLMWQGELFYGYN